MEAVLGRNLRVALLILHSPVPEVDMTRFTPRSVLLLAWFLFLTPFSHAYTTYQAAQGPLKLYFGEPDSVLKLLSVTQLETPQKIHATLENTSDKTLSLELTFRTVETIELVDADSLSRDTLKRSLELAAKETKTVDIEIVALPGTYSAHYPLHLDVEFTQDGKKERTNIVLVLETKFSRYSGLKNAHELPLNVLPERGGLFVSTLNSYRGVWYYDGDADKKPPTVLPVGFSGTDEKSASSIYRQNVRRGGEFRQSINMHPPYRGGVGNVGVEYRIRLPETTPISLSFFSAVRDTKPPETPSDGVTFRVLVDKDLSGKFETVYEKHNAETIWVENEVDLSRFAGKEIILRLESDPGPKRNTNCDSCYWGDVMLFAGEKPVVLSVEEKQKLFDENLDAVKTGKSVSKNTQIFALDGGLVGVVTFGNNGFLDGVIGLGNAEKQLQFDGLRVWCKDQPIGYWPSAIGAGSWISENETSENVPPRPATKPTLQRAPDVSPGVEQRFAQEIEIDGRSGTLFFSVSKNGPALQFRIDASEIDLIGRIEFGPATHHANRVYYGHGYCIEEPKAFTVYAGGHTLSTSHVGMDFENGISVLQASSFPVDRFIVQPETKRYTLGVHPATTITLLPGLSGAMDCAIRYRPICGNTAAPGVKEKAGRFVFDVWGGRYAEHLETLKHAVRYGLTDSQFIVHNWQRWGYDNRLPDIWPPNPRLGTLEDMQKTLEFCDKHGIQYGVHDNYIDFYPDAEQFDFDVTTFHENGQPKKAWNNYGIEAQSYQFRPDRVQEFLERNLDLMVPELPMSTYFVDVFTSIPPIDYYDREGNFHSRAETREDWARAFDTIRDRLSKSNKNFPSATTSSEAGMDSLIGHLDGADCQFMFLSPEPGEFRTKIECKSWSRVPWFDAVHHTTFSLHGVGYSGRYETGRGRALHGIESDDYITSEILTGHSLMVDWASSRRGAVRKYWLAQDLIRHLADKEIVNVGGITPMQYEIRWSDGTIIYVNLEKEDWTEMPNGIKQPNVVIPQNGYFAIFPDAKGGSCILRRKGRVAEYSAYLKDGKDVRYVNARQKMPGSENLLPVVPKLNSFEYAGENRFEADFRWDAKDAVSKDLCVFVHCTQQRMNWHQKLDEAVLGGGYPSPPTSQWKGETVSDKLTMSIPDSLPAGRYYLVVGLYDQKGDGHRARLMGFDTGANRYAVCWIKVERNGPDGKVSDISTEPIDWNDEELCERLLPPEEPVDFGICRTKGAFRIVIDSKNKTAEVTPLPEEPDTELWLNLPSAAKNVQAVDPDGKVLRDVPFDVEPGTVHFTTRAGEFRYVVSW